ncbi:MarR family winged helix-turn-helix transcriptional regulator [Paenibacillus endoradicis]|uniref:MarR family winged helix-turn-helix transcriptional regulator n=1 Tax=Paenibacillus endoradicis TaxID=2972487 RepID=UPI002159678C|nr:MarR family transcriptional regulator [Paenibacillus endoradicis]MCR8656457.1 MarR family transcriptional regulator [Paenibacillus endoradicis]
MDCEFSEQEHILHILKGLGNSVNPKFERCTGISSSRYDLLYQLYIADEVNQSTLQKAVNIDSAAITRHLKQLELEGMVSRWKSQADNRVTFVRLTDNGRNQIEVYKKEKINFLSQMMHDFDAEELKILSNMLTRMQHNIIKY